MPTPLEDLVALLDLEAIEVNVFRGYSPKEKRQQRVFGGQVASQALVAAARTVESESPRQIRRVHSLHAYFLRPGDPAAPILYEVDRIRDGRSFTTRRVVAIQRGEAIFNLQASFHADEPGLDYQAPMPADVPAPESLPDYRTFMAPYQAQLGAWYDRPRPIDVRYVDVNPFVARDDRRPSQRVWFRADGTLPDDPVLHTCLLTYASDMTLIDVALLPHGIASNDPRLMIASLDHAMWFHRPFRADEWLLYAAYSPSTAAGRGLAYGFIYTQDGQLAASVVQEGLIRLAR